MNIRSEISDSFQIFGTKLTTEIINKCEEICNTYNVSPEDLANQWAAYAVSNLNGAAPTVDELANMERKEFMRKGKDGANVKSTSATPTSIKTYKADPQEIDPDVSIVDAYSTPKSTRKTLKRPRSPAETPDSKSNVASKLIFSPPTHNSTPIPSPLSAHIARVDFGSAVLSYGAQELLQQATFKRNSDDEDRMVSVELWLKNGRVLSSDVKSMHETVYVKSVCLNSMTEWLGRSLLKKYNLEDPKPCIKSTTGTIVSYGRIACDTDGRLNAASVLLENTEELGEGVVIPLNLSRLPKYALFPGQVVAVEGLNSGGKVFYAQKLFNEVSPASPSEYSINFKESLQIVVASGPYTFNDDLQYKPLQDLIKYVLTNTPHVLILIGPFVDETHKNIRDGTITESYDDFFENLIQCIMTPLEGRNIQVILVSSHKDAHHNVVFPTPPYEPKKKYPNLHCVADPSLIDIEGMIVGVTSTDILLHLSREELCNPGFGGDRMSRIISHLFHQQNFYPLYPIGEDMSIDHELLERYGILDVMPHLMILPSNLRCFVKSVEGCVVVNPEHLAKGYIGGTFSRIQVFPPDKCMFPKNNIISQIIRI